MAGLKEILSWFEKNKYPTQEQFKESWTSFWHKSEKMPMEQVVGLQDELSDKALKSDLNAVETELKDKASKEELANVVAGLVPMGSVANLAELETKPKRNNDAYYVEDQLSPEGNAYIYRWDAGLNLWVNTKQVVFKDVITQGLGDSSNKAMSQDAVSKEFASVRSDLNEIEQEQIQGGVYDVSSHNDGAVFESISALLGSANLSTLIPTPVRRGGMSIRFIQGSVPNSYNKYVQYRLMHPLDNVSTAAADFVNTANWQGVDSKPTAGSKNLVESGGVKADIDANNIIEGKVFFVTDGDGNIIAKIDEDGVHSVDFKVGLNGVSLVTAIANEVTAREEGDATVKGLVEAEEDRAKAVEDTKLNYAIADNKLCITDVDGYIICQIDTNGVHSVNIDENPEIIADDALTITDSNGYIIAKIDANGVHSAKDKRAVACMVLSESYYPTAAPTRDNDGNVTHAQVMFETGVAGSISITYTNGNSSNVAVVYGNYNYTITINRDANGNVETVNVQ